VLNLVKLLLENKLLNEKLENQQQLKHLEEAVQQQQQISHQHLL